MRTTDVESVKQRVVDYLRTNDDFLLTTHLTPDGDGIGSQLALYRFLKRIGKKVRIMNCSSVPPDLRFLVRPGEAETFMKDRHLSAVAEAGTIIAFDLGGACRLGRMERPVRTSAATKILVDHHDYADELFDIELLDMTASSSSEITFDVIRAAGGEIDLPIAEPLYVGILQDTGSFNYNCTTRKTHEIAGLCLDAGVNPHRIWKKLNCNKSFRRVRLMGLNISRISIACGGRLASLKVDLEFLKAHDGEVRDAFEVVNHLLTIEGIEIGMLALQIGSKKVKFSLRSSGRHDVCAIAKEFGGGGHRYAAGCTVEGMDTEEAYQTMLTRLQSLLDDGE